MKLHPSIKSITFVRTQSCDLCSKSVEGDSQIREKLEEGLDGRFFHRKPCTIECKTCGIAMIGYPPFVNECDSCHCP
jgi:hypothetical protein